MSTLAPPPTPPVVPPEEPKATSHPTRRVARRGVGVLAIRIIGLAATTLASFAVARLLGPARLGVYEAAMAWAAVLVVPVLLGFDRLVLRETAAHEGDRARTGSARRLFRSAWRTVSWLACGLAAAAAGLAWAGWIPPTTAWVAVTFVPVLALLRLAQARLQAHGRILAGSFAELAILPSAFLLAVVAIWLLDLRSPAAALSAQAGAALTALATVLWLGRGIAVPDTDDPTETPPTDPAWRTALLPLTLIALLQILNARLGVLLTDGLAADGEVGRYAIAYRIAGLIQIPLLAINAALGPAAASLTARGEHAELQQLVTRCARQAFGVGLLVAACVFALGAPVLELLGPGFPAAGPALWTLCIAQLANVAMGSVGLLLLMTGHERVALLGLGAGIVASVAAGLLLIPPLGALGAACATGAGLVAWNVALWIAVRSRLRIGPTILGARAGASAGGNT